MNFLSRTALLLLLATSLSEAAPVPLGQEQTMLGVVLPGAELMPRPDPLNKAPVRLRVTVVQRHGTAGFQYNISYYGLEAGPHDLAKYLVRADGSEPGPLTPVPVEFAAVLPPGPPKPLPQPAPATLPAMGGYRFLIGVCLVVWAAVLVWILNGLRKPAPEPAAPPGPASPADRLRPLLERARDGQLDAAGRAEFERILLGFWSKRLGDGHLTAAERLARLRQHPEAGPLLLLAETWLHAPPGRAAADSEQQIARALAPLVG